MENLVFDVINHMHWSAIIMAMLAVFAGSIIQGATGLGLGMVAAPVLMIIDPVFVPGPLLMLAMMVSLLMVIREWKNIDTVGLSMALIGRIPGTILAAAIFASIPLALFGITFGVMVLAAVLLSATRWRFVSSKRNLLCAGFASGFMGTLTSIGAPPLALAYQDKPAAVIRSTMAAFFALGCAFSIAMLIYFGGFAADHLLVTVVFIPPLLIGFKISNHVVTRLNSRTVRLSLLTLSGLSAVTLIARSVIALY